MQILAVPKNLFDETLKSKGITDENVEKQDKFAFISINNTNEIKDEFFNNTPYFSANKSNVIRLWFDDVLEDHSFEKIGGGKIELKAITHEQAKELFQFIKKNSDKEVFFIHCTAGICRSGAVAAFIQDYIGKLTWQEFKRQNPHISPNSTVYRMLHDVWYNDH